ncbi:unnamed protein product [Enterobius vermicularis]|uniref:Fibrinogen C-terminal domain-containing protein n=1 Tax=Enterobius vermicularis TaxID=51028 RepID=A0A0N4V0M1_ENTVE|nr:unnamed protein product [Enterobius vermicularis]
MVDFSVFHGGREVHLIGLCSYGFNGGIRNVVTNLKRTRNLMFFKIIFLILLTIILSEVQSCDIQLKLVSETDKEVEVQLIIPGLRLKTEKLSFKKKGERRLVKVQGKNCFSDFWTIKLWKKEDGNWVLAETTKRKLDGNGWIQFRIDDIPRVSMLNGFGVINSGL